jgi:hypothetical protein
MAGLVDVFVDLCREKFEFLVAEFGCREASVHTKSDTRFVVYQNSTTAIGVYYEARDRAVWTVVMRLVNGAPPAYGDARHCAGLWTLLRLRAPATEAQGPNEVRTEADMAAVLSGEAEAVRTYAADILSGDFSVFLELLRIQASGQQAGPA